MEFSAMDVSNGDCKAIGLPRTSEEVFAVRNLGIDHNLVRQGILTLADLEKSNKTSNKRVEKDIVMIEKQDEIEEKKEGAEQVATEEKELSLSDLKEQYKAKFGKNIPPMYLKNTEWIVNKLNS